MLKKLYEHTGKIKFVCGSVATFATGYSLLNAPDLLTFGAQFFAGMLAGMAILICTCGEYDYGEDTNATTRR